jgi:prolyl-tRNA editing enzyme YbaK/EbsC (Cys-tRNA(Pro) deacylase)
VIGWFTMPTTLDWVPALDRPALLAEVVAELLASLAWENEVRVAEIDPDLADTAAFSAAYTVPLEQSANCVVVAGRRGDRTTLAACVVLATTRADVNGLVRRRLDARKASFAPEEQAVSASGMAFGGITPIGLPPPWPLLIDDAVARTDRVIVGSGIRGSKLLVPGTRLAELPSAVVLPALGLPVSRPPTAGETLIE